MLPLIFRFSYRKVNFISTAKKHMSRKYTPSNIKILTELYGFSGDEVVELTKRLETLMIKETSDLVESYYFLSGIGITNKDLMEYPNLLISPPVKYIQYYNSLKDSGCEPINAHLLSKTSLYFNKRKISRLKILGYLENNANVAERLMSFLDPPIETPLPLRVDLSVLDNMRWSEIHFIILKEWLKVRLSITDEEVMYQLRVHHMIKNKSFRIINENIKLAESLGLSRRKILRSGYLLHNYPKYPKTMLKHYPFFSGIDFANLYKTNPKTMMINPKRIMEIYDILKEFNITDEQFQRHPGVLTLSPETLRTRLKAIQDIPEFRSLRTHSQILMLVLHHNMAKVRLQFLRNLKIRCTNLNIGATNTGFDAFLHQDGGNKNLSMHVISFFSRLLEVHRDKIKKRLPRHPYFHSVPFADIEATFDYLVSLGYRKEHMAMCPYILLYPKSKIWMAVSSLALDKKISFYQLNRYKQLSVILYSLEKKHHFSGEGIWRTYAVNVHPDPDVSL